jgi:hypothetical protein
MLDVAEWSPFSFSVGRSLDALFEDAERRRAPSSSPFIFLSSPSLPLPPPLPKDDKIPSREGGGGFLALDDDDDEGGAEDFSLD